MVNSLEYVVFPDINSGQQKISEKTNSDKEYFAFGSDDIVVRKANRNSNAFDNKIKNGKDIFRKFGSFLSSSVQNITKPKNAQEEITAARMEDKPKTESFVELRQFSAKLGQGFLNFGVF